MAVSTLVVMILLAACVSAFPERRAKRGYNGYQSSYSGGGYGSSDERDASVTSGEGCSGGGYSGRGEYGREQAYNRDRDSLSYRPRGRYFSRAAAAASAYASAYKLDQDKNKYL